MAINTSEIAVNLNGHFNNLIKQDITEIKKNMIEGTSDTTNVNTFKQQ